MAGKVSEVKVGPGGKNLGTFKCEVFNILEDKERELYAELRTKAQNAASGIKIERAREYIKEWSEVFGDGEESRTLYHKDLCVIVEYWEKPLETKTRVVELPGAKPGDWSAEKESNLDS